MCLFFVGNVALEVAIPQDFSSNAFETLSEDNPHKNCGTEEVNKLDLQGLRGNG